MAEHDIHGVRDMSPEELEVIALGYGSDGGRTGAAKVQIERNRRAFEERLVKDQIDANEKLSQTQIRVARASFWAALFAAAAAVALAFVAISEMVIHLS